LINVKRLRGFVWLVFFITFALNLSALTITSYMITTWPCDGRLPCVGEGNAMPAYIFENYGIPAMYVIDIFMWSLVVGFVWVLGKLDERTGKNFGLAIQLFLVAGMFLIVFPDFMKNVSTLMWIIWAT
jgi:hypothetical protein